MLQACLALHIDVHVKAYITGTCTVYIHSEIYSTKKLKNYIYFSVYSTGSHFSFNTKKQL